MSDDLLRQIDLLLDGELSESETADLYRRAAVDPTVADALTQATMLHTQVGEQLKSEISRDDRPLSLRGRAGAGEPPHAKRFRTASVGYGIAAALVLTAAVVAIYIFVINPQTDVDESKLDGPPIATLIETTGTVMYEDDIARSGGEYASGMYSIESGSAKFLLRSHVSVDLSGKTMLHVHSPMSTTLTLGAARFRVPSQAVGFSVALPDRSRIVDLGTGFNVHVDHAGHALLSVTEGAVRWDPAHEEGTSVTLEAGRFARVINSRLVDLPVAAKVSGADWPHTLSRLDKDAAYADGKVRFTGTEQPGPTMVRTHRSDYHRYDWTAQFVFTIDKPDATNSPAFIGIGPGEIRADKYHAPVAQPNALVAFRTDNRAINVFDNTDTPALIHTDRGRVAHKFNESDNIIGPHRVAIRFNAASQIATFVYDHGNDRKIDTRFNVNVRDNKFTAETARIFFGGDRATLYHFAITEIDNKKPDAASSN